MASGFENVVSGGADVWDEISFYGEDYFSSGTQGGYLSHLAFWLGGMGMVAPSTFNAAWARNSNTVLGVCIP